MKQCGRGVGRGASDHTVIYAQEIELWCKLFMNKTEHRQVRSGANKKQGWDEQAGL